MSEVASIYNGYIKPMRFTIDTRKPKARSFSNNTATNQYKLNLYSDDSYDFIVDWGDGKSDRITQYDQAEVTHTYDVEGEYEITMSGKLGKITWSSVDTSKLLKILDFGTAKIVGSSRPFGICNNFTLHTKTPPIFHNDVKSITGLWFRDCSSIAGDFSLFGTADEPIVGNISGFMQEQGLQITAATDVNVNFVYETTPNTSFNTSFYYHAFNGDLDNWDTSEVIDMSNTFGFGFNNDSIVNWDVSKVTNFYSCFSNNFNQDITGWNVSAATDMRNMFFNNSAFNQPIGNWDVSNVTNMSNMFRLSQFKQDISSWDVSNVSNMFGMFYDSQFNIDIGSWNVSNVTNFSDMFRNRRTFTRPHFNNGDSPSISGWTLTTDPTKSINMTRMFYENLDFNQPIGSWDMSRVTNISQMFYNRFSFSNGGAAFDQDLSNWDVSNVVDMYEFSFGLKSMSKENIASLNNWNVTSKCTRIGNVFNGPPDLTLLDLSGWDVSGCNDFWYAFSAQYGGQNLPFSPKVSGWTFSTATTVNIRATGMFYNRTTFNEDITGWNTERFNSTSSMFSNCSSFNQNLGVWNISNNGNMSGMFNNSGMSTENYSNTLIGWASQAPNIQSNVPLGASGISYNASAQDAVDLLTGTYGWTITDSTP